MRRSPRPRPEVWQQRPLQRRRWWVPQRQRGIKAMLHEAVHVRHAKDNVTAVLVRLPEL